MNAKADDATEKVMCAFKSGGLVPLDLHQYAVVDAHIRSILARAMENKWQKKRRKWNSFQRAKHEAGAR